jgi:ankyrin repeat protein
MPARWLGLVAALVVLLPLGRPAGAEPAAAEATAKGRSAPDPAAGGKMGHVLGIGEPRAPQPYTLEDRFLEAARQGDRATLELALEKGVDVDAKDDLGRSALLLAARDAGSLDLVRYLHQQGAPIDEADLGGRTPLSWAAGAGRLDLVRWLVEQGAAVDRLDTQRRTPLFHAVLGHNPEVVIFLLDHGAAVDSPDRFGDTPLIMACAKGYGDLARLLLAHGADPEFRDQEGRTAGDRAAPGTDACLPPPPR